MVSLRGIDGQAWRVYHGKIRNENEEARNNRKQENPLHGNRRGNAQIWKSSRQIPKTLSFSKE
jgi:hypothetical protein